MQEFPLLSEDQLADMPVFSSLEEALEDPENCYILELAGDAESEKTLAEALPRLPRIQQFTFQDNTQVANMPRELAQLKHLQVIEFRDSILETLPEELGELKHVTDFVLTGCKYVTEFPAFICNWTELIYLEITDTQIEEIPSDIGNLTKLEDLNINQNKLVTLPHEISALQSLRILRTYGNYAMTIPSSLKELQDLETFDHGLIQVLGTTVLDFRELMPNTTFSQITSYDEIKEGDDF